MGIEAFNLLKFFPLFYSADAINRVPTFEMKPLKNGIRLTVKRVGSPTPFDKKKK
jgi:hypothetical protein